MSEEKRDPEKDPNGTGNGEPDGNQKGNPTVEDLKNLQKIITEKDKALKDAEKKLEEFGKNDGDEKKAVREVIASLEGQIKNLVGEVEKVNLEKRAEALSKKYPDILPELLAGKSDEQVEKIVTSQRELSKKIYGDSQFFQQPTYKDSADIDKAVETVLADKKKTGLDAAVDVLRLSRLKNLIR